MVVEVFAQVGDGPPVKGQVLQTNVRRGEYVGIPPGQPLMVLGDVSTLHVRMDVDETDIGRFRPDLYVGQQVDVYRDAGQ